jgi:hypothetical protein
VSAATWAVLVSIGGAAGGVAGAVIGALAAGMATIVSILLKDVATCDGVVPETNCR